MWYDPILEVLMESLVTIVIALIGLAVAYGTHYIKKASQRLQEKSEMELVDNLIANVEHVVLVTVEAAEQRVAKDLRDAVKDGKVDRAELLAVADSVKEQVLATLSNESIELLKKTFGDIEILIENMIESAVAQVKK